MEKVVDVHVRLVSGSSPVGEAFPASKKTIGTFWHHDLRGRDTLGTESVGGERAVLRSVGRREDRHDEASVREKLRLESVI